MQEIGRLLKKTTPYILVILITINIHDFIVQTSSDTTFVNNFNFASTITSIILSVVAIIYTLIEGSQSKGIQNKMFETADDIQKSVNELKKVSSEMKNFNSRINELEENIRTSNSELAATLTHRDGITPNEINRSNSMNDELEDILGNFSLESIRNCFLFNMAYRASINLNISDFNNYYDQILIEDDLPPRDITGSILSTLDIVSSLGYIQYTISGDNVRIVDFDHRLEEAMSRYIPEEENYSDSYDSRLFGTVYRYFRR